MRRFDDAPITSILPLSTDIGGTGRHVSKVPKNEPALAGGRWPGGRVHWVYRSNHLNGAQVTGGRSVLRIEGFKHSNLKTGAPNEREAHQPAAPTHARRHEHAQVRTRYATRVYPCRQEARDFPRPFPRRRDGGRAARVPTASDRDGCATTEHQRDRDCTSVLLQGDAR